MEHKGFIVFYKFSVTGVVIKISNRDKFEAYKWKNDDYKILSGILSNNKALETMSEDMLEEL